VPFWGTPFAALLAMTLLSACSGFGGGGGTGGASAGTGGASGGGPAAPGGEGGGLGGGESTGSFPQFYFPDVAFDRGVFVAVGWVELELGSFQGSILTSTDGEHWSESYRDDSMGIPVVAAGSEGWIALGPADEESNFVLTSPDGTAWEEADERVPGRYADVVWTGSRFLVASEGGSLEGPTVWESSSGTTWDQIQGVQAGIPLAAGPAGIVAGGEQGLSFSADEGQSWEHLDLVTDEPDAHAFGAVGEVFWDGTRFGATSTYQECCSGEDFDAPRHFYRLWSDDGLVWEWEETEELMYAFAWLGDVGVAVSGIQLRQLGLGSRDGEWTFTDTSHSLNASAAGEGSAGGRFVSVGWNAVIFSDDGITWHEAELPTFD